jgi:hypothetical protein
MKQTQAHVELYFILKGEWTIINKKQTIGKFRRK